MTPDELKGYRRGQAKVRAARKRAKVSKLSPPPESFVKTIHKRTGGRVTVSYHGGLFYAHAYPSTDAARQAVVASVERETAEHQRRGRTVSINLDEFAERIAKATDTALAYGSGRTIADALVKLATVLP